MTQQQGSSAAERRVHIPEVGGANLSFASNTPLAGRLTPALLHPRKRVLPRRFIYFPGADFFSGLGVAVHVRSLFFCVGEGFTNRDESFGGFRNGSNTDVF